MDIIKFIPQLTFPGFLVFVVGVAIAIGALTFMRKPEHIPPPPVADTRSTTVVVKIENWERSQPREIQDSRGYRAEIETVVLSNDFSWEFGSHTSIQRKGEEADIKLHLMSPGVSSEIAKYAEVVAVGAASMEGADVNPAEEASRASRRADQLQLWIKEYVGTSNPLYRLSLGYFKGATKSPDSSEQRKVVVIGIVRMDKRIDLSDALRTSLPQVGTFPFALADYSEFELIRAR